MLRIATLKVILFLLLPLLAFGSVTGSTSVTHWSDLDIAEQIRIIFGSVLILMVAYVGKIIFTSIWVKDGYSGEDKILVDREVSLFVFHVLAYCAFVFFCFLAVFEKYNNTPFFIYQIDALVFLSPEAINILHRIMDKVVNLTSKKNKGNEPNSKE